MESLAAPTLRLAILPSSDSAEDESYFSVGFVEDLVTDLSRFAHLGLISPHSSFAARLRELGDKEIAEDLKADLLLKTSVRKRQSQIRINAQLVDPNEGSILWAERFESPEEDVFALQDGLVEKVVAALSVRIDAVTLDAARRKPVTELEAYDCWLRGLEKLRGASIATDEEARELFEQALEVDPHYARAYVGLSLSHFNEWSCNNWNLSELHECRAFQYANRALQLDRSDSVAHLVAGRVHLFRGEFEKASEHIDIAFELNPNDADHLVQIASCKTFLGDDRAADIFDRALMLNPYCNPWYYAYGGFIQILRKNFAEGIAMGLKSPLTTVWIDLPAFIALAYANLGDYEEAAVYRKVFLDAFQEKILYGRVPRQGEALTWVLAVNPFLREEDTKFFRDGLLLAGFSEAEPDEIGDSTAEVEICREQKDALTFRKEDDLRLICFDGRKVRLPEVKGYKDIERLLSARGEEIHCSELMGSVSEDGGSPEVMDSQARSECAEQIRALQAELHEAEEFNDLARAAAIREELDPLIDHLAKALGVGQRSRKLAAPAERARSAVTWRIRSAIRKIEAAHPSLGRHLSHSVKTGTFCSFEPETPENWLV